MVEPARRYLRNGNPSQSVQARRVSLHWRRHFNEVFVKINGGKHYLWRAVDHESDALKNFITTSFTRRCSHHRPR